MLKSNKFVVIVFNLFATWATAAAARPVPMDWIPGDGMSCYSTCSRYRAMPVEGGIMNVPVNGDPRLYVCRAYVPGSEQYGTRAGYNWNGSIGNNYQPGCTIVGGSRGFSSTNSFECLCQFSHGRDDFGRDGDRGGAVRPF